MNVQMMNTNIFRNAVIFQFNHQTDPVLPAGVWKEKGIVAVEFFVRPWNSRFGDVIRNKLTVGQIQFGNIPIVLVLQPDGKKCFLCRNDRKFAFAIGIEFDRRLGAAAAAQFEGGIPAGAALEAELVAGREDGAIDLFQ